jgi:hypothetical protein
MTGRKNCLVDPQARPGRPVGVCGPHFGNHCCISYKTGHILYCFISAAFVLVYVQSVIFKVKKCHEQTVGITYVAGKCINPTVFIISRQQC